MSRFALLLSLSITLFASAPAMAQGNVRDYYKNRYGGGGSSGRSPEAQYTSPRNSAPPAVPDTFSNAPTYSGAYTPENLPNANQKGFGKNSHWLERPGANGDISALSNQVDGYIAKISAAKSRGDLPGAAQANAAMQNLCRQLESMEPQNAKWKVLKAVSYINQGGGPSRSGTAGDRFTLQQAIRELDLAAACPNSAEYMSQIKNMRATTDVELKKRIAKGEEIKRRGARQFAEIYNMKGGGGDAGGGPSWCTVCGHMHGPGNCTYRRD